MRLVENSDTSDSDANDSALEMYHPFKSDQGKSGTEANSHHTEEYWKTASARKTKADWVKEEEVLNRGHRASETFAVLNELVVVRSTEFGK